MSSRGRSWLMARLDSLLSESLRKGSPSDLIRLRIMVAAICFLLVAHSLFLLWSTYTGSILYTSIISGLSFVGALVLARRATTPSAPAMVLLVGLSIGMVGGIFENRNPIGAAHAMNALLPALAVYLVGPRLGLPITLFMIAALGLVHPFYRMRIGFNPCAIDTEVFWFAHIFACISFLGTWALGSLHSTARNAAQASLERAMKELRDSENKLNSIIESTDDIVLSLDPTGRLLTANSAAKHIYQQRVSIVLELGMPLFHHETPERRKLWDERLAQVRQGQRLRFEETYEEGGPRLVMDISMHPIIGEDGRVVGVTIFSHDVTSRKEAETRLGEMHRTLVDVSRQAGMAEIATGVLHNVGNTLNSVNISTSLVTDRLRQSRLAGLAKAIDLLRQHVSDIPSFLARDPQGQKLPAYLFALSDQLQEEREAMLQEMRSLGESVEHIKSIVSMQQKHARTAGAMEQVAVPQLINEALRLHAISFERMGIRIERDYAEVPPLCVDRHKLLQILVNLMSNAQHALVASPKQDKRLEIHIRPAPAGDQVLIEVTDNGIGISPENMARIFTQGFTTKKTGHGFGLHISALAAVEMKGRLTCSSPGPEQGATFTLELPMKGEDPASGRTPSTRDA